jgi:TonB family protein
MMRWAQTVALGVGLVLAHASPALADDSAKWLAQLHAAEAATALDTPDMKPWHLKLSVQLFDSAGKPADQGNVEEWWDSPELNRTEYKTSSYSATEIRKEGRLYRTKGADFPPYYLELLRRQIVHPMPRGDTGMKLPNLRLRKLNAGKLAMDCIELGYVIGQQSSPLGSVPAYCFGRDTDTLRMSAPLLGEVIGRDSIGSFAGREVSGDVGVSANSVEAAKGHIDVLTNSEIPRSSFDPSDDTPEVTPPIVDDDGIPMKLISQAFPLYPAQAKAQHVSGTVVLRAIIGTDGAVRNLETISSASPLLISGATDAVKQWKYQPYLVNGVPTEVVKQIVTTFRTAP